MTGPSPKLNIKVSIGCNFRPTAFLRKAETTNPENPYVRIKNRSLIVISCVGKYKSIFRIFKF